MSPLFRAALLAALAAAAAPYGWAGSAKPPAITVAAPAITVGATPAMIGLVPGGGPVHVEADDQGGRRLEPRLFSWLVPAGAMIGVQEDGAGWLLSAPQGAAAGNYSIPVEFAPNPALSPTVLVAIGTPISKITIVVSPNGSPQ